MGIENLIIIILWVTFIIVMGKILNRKEKKNDRK